MYHSGHIGVIPGTLVSGLVVFSLASVLQKYKKAGSHVRRSRDHEAAGSSSVLVLARPIASKSTVTHPSVQLTDACFHADMYFVSI